MAILLSSLVPTRVAAQPTGYQEYYVLGYEEHVWRAFLDIYDGPDSDIPSRICSTVSLVATADFQVIYHDHWEDGYEADLLNPVQPTTEIYGDGDPSNGGTGSDTLLTGDEVSLTSDQNNGTIHGYVPVNPRDVSQIRYDGGDHVISSGGPVDLTHAMWPLGTSWVGGAWEVYSRQAYANAYSYRLPIGEDLYALGGGSDGSYGDFRNVYLQLAAFEDGTTVLIDNGADVVNLVLDRGQTYSSMGYLDSTWVPSITINSGTTVRSNKPTQVGLITGADSNRTTFQGRFLIALPEVLWGSDYIVPVPRGNDTSVGRDAPAEIYLSNPNDFPITVKACDRGIQTTFVISPATYISATVPYSEKRGGLGYVAQDSAARFSSSDGTFNVVVCADTSDFTYDWGFAGIPTKYLTRDYYIPWAPGTTDLADNGAPVWVTPLADGTTFYVDFSPLDGVVDQNFTLDMLEQRRIFDPDNDNTGMHVWATGEFAVAWGEDPRVAGTGSDYLDLGLTTLPLQQRWLDPVLTLDKIAEPTILPSTGGAVTFTLLAQAYNAPLVNVDITDTLPVSWTYVPGSTQITYSDGNTGNPEPTIDDRTLFWDLSADLGLNQSLTLTFRSQITDTAGVTVSVNHGEAVGKYEYAGVLFNPTDEATVYVGALNLIKSVSSAQARIGDTLIYTLSYTNTSDSTPVTDVTLRDAVPIQHVAFESASDGAAYNPASGTIGWTADALAPGASGSVTFTVRVNDFVEDGTVIENVGYIDCAQMGEAGSNVVRTTVLAPDIEFTKSGPAGATRGQVMTYTLSYGNVGTAEATGVVIEDVIPVSTTYVTGSLAIDTGSGWVALTDAADGDQGGYISPTLTVTPGVIPGVVAPGEAGRIRFSVRVDDGLPPDSLIQNWATLDRDLSTPRESNVAVTRIFDLLIGKAAEQEAVTPGDAISYTLVYENVSTTMAQTEVYVREPIPDYTSLVPGTAYGGDHIEYSWDNGAGWSATFPVTPVTHIRWYDAEVPTGAQVAVGFAVQVTPTLPFHVAIQNTAHISSTEAAAYLREWVPSNQVEVAVIAPEFSAIGGTVFEDADGDGVRDAGESGISGVLITLDGVITTTTDLNGDYTFSTTVAGVHTVVETDPSVYAPLASDERYRDFGDIPELLDLVPMDTTDPPSYFSTTPNEVHVDVVLGNDYWVNFGDMLTNSGFAAIYGTVFEDADGDGVRDTSELGIPDVLVALDGMITTTTDLNGNYTLSTTVAGTHTVAETDPDGHFSTTPNEVCVKVILGNGYRIEFGDAPASSGFATIYGTVFEDADGDGVRGTGEVGIPDVFVALDGAITTTTDLNGRYTFSTTVTDTHTVVEIDPDGYFSTTRNEVDVDVALCASFQVDFGDMPPEEPCVPDFYEPDDIAAQATDFDVGRGQAHNFCDDATDWVKFSAEADTLYTIVTFSWGQRADTFLALFDTDGRTLLAANDDYEGTTDYSSRIAWRAPADGTYYVRITNRAGLIGHDTDYDVVIERERMSVIYLPLVMRDYGGGGIASGHKVALYPTGVISHTCRDAYEPDDTWQQASAIEVGVVQVHSFDSNPATYVADKDFVWFHIFAGGTVSFTVAPVTNTRTLMELYDERGAALGVTGTAQLVWTPGTSGRYYLSVSPQDGVTSFGCADAVGYHLWMEMSEPNVVYLPVVTRGF